MKNDVIEFDRIDEQGPQTYDRTFDVAVADLGRDEVISAGSVTINGTVEKGGGSGDYVADGTVTATADLECSRCADPYPFAITSPFHVTFRPRPQLSAEEEVEITDAEELDVEFYSEREISLRDLALEQVQLAIPMKPLCDENCLGLCPTCGVHRSREQCTCGEAITDERWGALKGLREELAKKNNV